MQVTDRNGQTQEINEGDKIIITLYDSLNKPITTMNSEAYEPHEVIKQGGQLGVIWGNCEEFTPLRAFFATFEKVQKKDKKTMTRAEAYQGQCDNCEHCNAAWGACKLQDFNHCVSVCKTWAEVYKNCPIKKQNNNK